MLHKTPSIIIFWKAKDLPLNTKVFLKQFCQNTFPSLLDMFKSMRNIDSCLVISWLLDFSCYIMLFAVPWPSLHIHNLGSCILSRKHFATSILKFQLHRHMFVTWCRLCSLTTIYNISSFFIMPFIPLGNASKLRS